MNTPENFRREREDALEHALACLYSLHAPKGFDDAWRAAVKKGEHVQMTPVRNARFWKIAAPAFAALVLVAGSILTGAANLAGKTSGEARSISENSTVSYAQRAAYDEAETAPMPMGVESGGDSGGALMSGQVARVSASDGNTSFQEKKIVRTADIALATSSFDAHEAAVRQEVDAAGGYVENVYQYEYEDKAQAMLRQISFTLRIPTENLDAFLTGISGIGRVLSRNESATDMTVQYSDTDLRLQTQREKMKRLQELLARAETVTDLVEIEDAIASTQYEIDRYETTLRSIDRQVDQSTVYVSLKEESPAQSAAETSVGLGDRLRYGLEASLNGISQFFQNMLVFVAMALPVLIPLAAAGAVIWLAVRRRRVRRCKTNQTKQEE